MASFSDSATDDDRNITQFRIVSLELYEGKPIYLRHYKVEENEMDLALFDQIERQSAIGGFEDFDGSSVGGEIKIVLPQSLENLPSIVRIKGMSSTTRTQKFFFSSKIQTRLMSWFDSMPLHSLSAISRQNRTAYCVTEFSRRSSSFSIRLVNFPSITVNICVIRC